MVAVAESEWDMGKIDTSAKHERGFVWRPDAVVLKSVKAERERSGWGALSRGELWSSRLLLFFSSSASLLEFARASTMCTG